MYTVFQKTHVSEPAVFGPSDTTAKIDGFPELCVSTFSENNIEKFLSANPSEKIAELYTANGVTPVYKTLYHDTEIAFYLSRVGAPACVAGFEEIVAMGAKKFVLFGVCGILDEEAVKDKIIVPTSAIRDEGVSYHYQEPSFEIEAEEKSISILEDTLKRCGCPYIRGKTWTTDAIYRETAGLVRERKEEGCLTVEMECASMLAVARYRNIPFIQFLYGADCLSADSWEIRDLKMFGLSNAEKYMALAFECALAMRQ